MITKEDLKKDVLENLEIAKEHVKNSKKGVLPAVFVKGMKGKQELCNVVSMNTRETGSREGRRRFLYKIGMRTAIDRNLRKIDSVESVYLISEAGMGVVEKKIGEELTEKDIYKSESKEERDIVFSCGMSVDLKIEVALSEIKKKMDFNSGLVNTVFVEIKELAGTDMSDLVSGNSLLESFWGGVDFIEDFLKEKPAALDLIKKLSEDEVSSVVEILMFKIDQLIDNKLK